MSQARAPKRRTEAVEVHAGRSDARILLTCEHASQELPSGWGWTERDSRLRDTHWAFDLGAAELTLELAEAMGATAVLSRFTRLLVDPNRPESSPTLFRDYAEGEPVELNTIHLDEAQRRTRIERFLRPYHAALHEEVAEASAPLLLAMHTFTPLYEGQPRTLEVGVLYDLDEALAERVLDGLLRRGLRAALQEPYSGRDGLMYSVDRHARAHSRQAFELEVRQDLSVDPTFRRDFVAMLREILEE